MQFETLPVECWSVRCKDCRAAIIVYSVDRGHDWIAAHTCGVRHA